MKRLLPLLVAALFIFCCQKKTAMPPEPPPEETEKQSEIESHSSPPAEHQHHVPGGIAHRERKIPTPLLTLTREPLDIAPACADVQTACSILILYEDEMVLWDWQKNEPIQQLPLRAHFATISRAPAGKVVAVGNGFAVMHNSLARTLFLDSRLQPRNESAVPALPSAAPGFNWFSMAEGKFYDFAPLEARGLAVIDTQYRLGIADSGKMTTSDQRVGSQLAIALPAVYTSAPTMPLQPDAILKFAYQDGALVYQSTRNVDGQIIGLDVTDLNRDTEPELLVTLKTNRGVIVDVLDLF